MQQPSMGWSRRDFLMRLGKVAGSGAMYRAMSAMISPSWGSKPCR